MGVEYRGKVRSGQSLETSWDAAALQSTGRVDEIKEVILLLLEQKGPMTDEELAEIYGTYLWLNPSTPGATDQNLRTRRKALQVEGLVRNTGERRPTRAGATAAVWRLTDRGDRSESTT